MPSGTVALPHRVFIPAPNENGETSADKLVLHCPNCDRCYVEKDIAIYIDGACSGNGTSNARAGIGVFVCCGSDWNVSRPLTDGPQTSQRAEIQAAITALRIARQFYMEGDFDDIRRKKGRGVVLISDSAYVVNAMTDWVDKWQRNGWKTSEGRLVTNMADFIELDLLVSFFEGFRIPVRFWKVRRSENGLADRLAKEAIGL
ncbi:hypothetical protein NP233_g11699 [Leucocoprinus birnbaumii]|uniref:ribonuclease H n=1 Tax=Leucocoprinus birnbaumii TaxID=56174 RepID=A0AAD5VFW8_9AGAR|nr:hypothetical protein NP233_g11699 [Leucocoprinus birnbaumii]